jgi:predicted nucleotidyltransferase
MLLKRYSYGVEILSVDEPEIKNLLREIGKKIKDERSEVNEIILFGSFAKRDYTPYSDIDVAIMVDHSDKKFIERAENFMDYFAEIPLDVNLIVYNSDEVSKMIKTGSGFLKEVLRGKRL